MIKVCLSDLLVYYMSLFVVPVAVRERLDRLRSEFLWQGSGNMKKLQLMQWENVIKSKAVGGLGLGKLYCKKLVLVGKEVVGVWVRVGGSVGV